jgi:SAM-dependent methyltransferase
LERSLSPTDPSPLKVGPGSSPWRARLASDQETVFSRFVELCDLRGATVLEIGGMLPESLVAAAGVAAWWAVDPRNPAAEGDGPVRPLRGRASALPLPDGSIDCVFSSNAFQHVHDLPETLDEAARVLKPGGVVYASFGPVWSAPDGSHIEALVWEGERYDFWDHSLLPSWAHLVGDEAELAAALAPLHGAGLAGAIARYVHRSDWINRLFFDDYARIFADSPLQVIGFGGCPDLDYEYRPPMIGPPLAERLLPERLPAEVQARHGRDKKNLDARDVEVLLRLA